VEASGDVGAAAGGFWADAGERHDSINAVSIRNAMNFQHVRVAGDSVDVMVVSSSE